VLRQLGQVLPPGEYDNSLHDDFILIEDPEHFRGDGIVRVYRARRQDRPVAVIMNLVAPDGYNGDIRLLAGIYRDGTISGVRVTAHRETPGLGDPIEHQRSDWILGFDGRSLSDPGPEGWAVRRDGGEFDQFTGATITPRAVVEAVERALEYHRLHADELYRGAGETGSGGGK
jgi:electron transport complex protein RnfG